jgi:hypothetical protein
VDIWSTPYFGYIETAQSYPNQGTEYYGGATFSVAKTGQLYVVKFSTEENTTNLGTGTSDGLPLVKVGYADLMEFSLAQRPQGLE